MLKIVLESDLVPLVYGQVLLSVVKYRIVKLKAHWVLLLAHLVRYEHFVHVFQVRDEVLPGHVDFVEGQLDVVDFVDVLESQVKLDFHDDVLPFGDALLVLVHVERRVDFQFGSLAVELRKVYQVKALIAVEKDFKKGLLMAAAISCPFMQNTLPIQVSTDI